MNVNFLWLIPFFPLMGSVLIRFLGKRVLPRSVVHVIACTSILASFLVTLRAFLMLKGLHHGEHGSETETYLLNRIFPWISIPNVTVFAGFLVDELSAVMTLIITGIGFLIHVYSCGYMSHEEDYERYFAYLNLFTAMMLILVLGESLLLMFVGWEGVGLCSYLLIGFWFKDNANADAGKKAFVVNRVGDFGVLIGMFTIFWFIGEATDVWSLDFRTIREHAHVLSNAVVFGLPAATFATLMLFLGCTGKSAQMPLYVWLPDAMAGPTPVSALIHAATMVTSGIYMICRLSFLFDMAPLTLDVIATVGALTAFFAATIGLVQNDIKKVLAYSTVSQLGYMFLGCGVGAYASGLFHVMTHAFFKALLFLGAGSVIHAMHHEQDMRKMGGLRKKIPLTHLTFLIGTLAIAGVFPLSGFFSKDEILWQVWNKSKFLWVLGIATAFMTAFYMFRLYHMTFSGKCRADHKTESHIHESPMSMIIPLMILAFLSIIGGWLWFPGFMHLPQVFPHWLEKVVIIHHPHGSHATELLLALFSLGVALAGIYLAHVFYVQKPHLPAQFAKKYQDTFDMLLQKYKVDEAYDYVFVRGTKQLAKFLFNFDSKIIDGVVNGSAKVMRFFSSIDAWFDAHVVDGLVNFAATAAYGFGKILRKAQTGNIQTYVGALTAGLALMGWVWLKKF